MRRTAWPIGPGPLDAPPGSDPRTPNETQLWQWLRGRHGHSATLGARLPLYLGYGIDDDRFAFSHRLLAAALPEGRVFTTEGGHDWPSEWMRASGAACCPRCSAGVPRLKSKACQSGRGERSSLPSGFVG